MELSLWTPTTTPKDKAGRINEMYEYAVTGKAKADITAGNAGGRFKLEKADVDSALTKLGFGVELTQEEIADMALIDPKKYLDFKRGALDTVRQKVVRMYLQIKADYEKLGYGEKEAEKIAKDAALKFKEAQMGIFNTLFPPALSGKKIEAVY